MSLAPLGVGGASHGGRVRWWPVLIAVALFLGVGICLYSPAEEDAFIYYRYALNFARGEGLVFNAGEAVEGFSGFSWMWLLALCAKLGVDLPIAGPVLSMLAGIATIFAARMLATVVGLRPAFATVAVLTVALSHSLIWWSRSGLETTGYACLLTWFAASHLGASRLPAGAPGRSKAGLLLAAVVLSRPEGVLLVAVVVLERWWTRDLRGLVPLLLPWAIAHAGLLLWRWHVFEALSPNTGVKVDPTNLARSTTQIFGYIASLGFSPVLMPIGWWLARRCTSAVRAKEIRFLLAAVVVVSVAFTLLAGGDYRDHYRFLVPTLPLLVTAILLVADTLAARYQRPVAVATAFVLLLPSAVAIGNNLFHVGSIGKAMREWRDPLSNADDYHLLLARWLLANAESGQTIAYGQMGKAPYYTLVAGKELRFVDTLGLVDREFARIFGLRRKVAELIEQLRDGRSWAEANQMARERLYREYGDYLFDVRRPDLLVIESHFVDTGRPLVRALMSRPEFAQAYQLCAEVPSAQTPEFRVYARR